MKNINEKYRPKFHYSVKKNWLNDPNGLVYQDGVYHMFYQYHPYSTYWGPMFWGHATSSDLLKWIDHPVALEPDQNGTCFSGSAVIDKNNTTGLFDNDKGLVAIYTSAQLGVMYAGREEQTQSIAYSKDNGMTWEKYEENPVIKNPGIKDFRDPKVIWYDDMKKWIMVLAAFDKINFYESKNLKDWKKISEFGEHLGVHEAVWECPELIKFVVNGKNVWILKISVQGGNPAGGTGEFYFTGEFDGKEFKEFKKNNYKWLDGGRDIYASQSWNNTEERNILIGWMTNLKYAHIIPTSENWRGLMTIPRELSILEVNKEYILKQLPIKEIEKYRKNAQEHYKFIIDNQKEYNIKNETYEILFHFETDSENLELIFSNKLNESLKIKFDMLNNNIFFNREECTYKKLKNTFNLIQKTNYTFKNKNTLRILVDKCSIEIFINEGEKVISNLIFPQESFSKFKILADKKINVDFIKIFKITIK